MYLCTFCILCKFLYVLFKPSFVGQSLYYVVTLVFHLRSSWSHNCSFWLFVVLTKIFTNESRKYLLLCENHLYHKLIVQLRCPASSVLTWVEPLLHNSSVELLLGYVWYHIRLTVASLYKRECAWTFVLSEDTSISWIRWMWMVMDKFPSWLHNALYCCP